MRIKKTSQTTSTQAQVVDGYSTSTTDSYSCNYVNNQVKDVYSTNEVKTNKIWIDEKPVYRKIFTGDIASSIEHGLTNVSFVNSYGYMMSSSGAFVTLPSVRPTNAGYYIGYYVTNQYIIFDKVADVNGVATITLEYTKTTD